MDHIAKTLSEKLFYTQSLENSMISLRTRIFTLFLKYCIKPLQTPGLIPMRGVYWFLHLLAIFWPIPKYVKVVPVSGEKVDGEFVTAYLRAEDGDDSEPVADEAARVDRGQIVYFIHGGGYFFGSPRTHRNLTWRLSKLTNRKVFSLCYRMAPNHPLTCSVSDAIEGYRLLLNKGYEAKNIVMGGDSAGGSLALLALQKINESDLPMPKAVFCLSPMTDMGTTGGSMDYNAKHDPVFHPRAMKTLVKFHSRLHEDAKHPDISPAYGKFKGFPPMLVQVGSTEILLDDAIKIVENAREDNVNVDFYIWDRMPHSFTVFAGYLPEATKGLEEVSDFIHRELAA